MNKYEIALDEIASRYFLVSDSIHGTSHEEDMRYFDGYETILDHMTWHEVVSAIKAMYCIMLHECLEEG